MASPSKRHRGERAAIAHTAQAAPLPLAIDVPPPADPFLDERAERIRVLGKRVIGDVIEIGRLLAECKVRCGHGNWLPWLKAEFDWKETTAWNFMQVYEMSKSSKFEDLNLPVSSLYPLAAPSTPESARAEVIERAEAGETLRHKDAP